MPTSMKQIIARILSTYSGRRVRPERLAIFPDPGVDNVWAVRWTNVGEFLITETGDLAKDVESVEEVEFTCWPPKSGVRGLSQCL